MKDPPWSYRVRATATPNPPVGCGFRLVFRRRSSASGSSVAFLAGPHDECAGHRGHGGAVVGTARTTGNRRRLEHEVDPVAGPGQPEVEVGEGAREFGKHHRGGSSGGGTGRLLAPVD